MFRYTIALAALPPFAGYAGAFPRTPAQTTVDIEPRIVGTFSTGGRCVEKPMTGQRVESVPSDGARTVTVEADGTVPGAHYVIDEITLRQIDDGKSAKECPDGASSTTR